MDSSNGIGYHILEQTTQSPIHLKGGQSHKDTSFTWKNITKFGNHHILIKISSHILDDAFKPKDPTQHVLPNLFIASLNQLADQGAKLFTSSHLTDQPNFQRSLPPPHVKIPPFSPRVCYVTEGLSV